MTNVFLGYPPEHIRKWIIEHSSNEPATHEKTWIWFDGQENYEEFDWSGDINQQTMDAAGLYDENDWAWPRNPVKIQIGTNVTSIGEYAFNYCSSLTTITIPDSVTFIGDHAFSHCSSLTTITIPDSVTIIEEYAFGECSNLTSITIGNAVTSIGSSVFNYCSSLTTITIPDSVTSIGEWAFAECGSLTTITIPNSVISIGEWAFNNCESLTTAEILGFTQAEIRANASNWSLNSGISITASDGTFTL